jgi:AraC-like DNA-binding protein
MQKNWLFTPTPSPLFLMPSMAIQVSAGSGTSLHSHTAAQIILALSGKLQVRMLPKAPFSSCNAVLIPPNVNHHIVGSGSLEVMIWFDPATIEARAIRLYSLSELIPLSKNEINIPSAKLLDLSSHLQTCSQAIYLSKIISQTLLPKCETVKPLDERIVLTLSRFQNPALLNQSYPLQYLAKKVNLSEGRLRHLFRQELGVTIQQYWIGHRLLVAIRRFDSCVSLTELAYEAGFADLAHFSRAFRASFGMNPSLAAKNSRSVQVNFCENRYH